MLNPTPLERLVDAEGRPYFLWDCEMTLDQFRQGVRDPNVEIRAYLIGRLMRQAKPDDTFLFVSLETIRVHWPLLQRYLGQRKEFWTWLLNRWEGQGDAQRQA